MIGRYINRILLLSTIVLIISFALIARFLYNKTNKIVIDFIELSIRKDLNTLENLIVDQEEQANKQFFYRLKIINNYLNSQTITHQPYSSQIPVININTEEENIAVISPLIIQGHPLDENFVKYIKFLSNTNVVILQKFGDGYVILYTDIDDLKRHGSKYYFPNNSEVALYIENKQSFVDKIQIKNKVYKMGVIPIFIGKDIQGAILLLDNQWFSEKFKTFFESQVYLRKGYPVLIDDQGNILLHPLLEGENIKNTNVFYKIFTAKNSRDIVRIEYRWPETPSGQQKILFVKYLPQFNYFLAISLYKSDFYNYTRKFKTYYLAAVIIALLVSLIFIFLIENLLLQRINNVRKHFEQLATGNITEPIPITGENYIALEKIYNRILDNFKKYNDFAEQLSKGNYQHQFTPVSNNDTLGHNLLKIRDHLQNVHKDIEQREQEEKIRAWRNTGIEKFINILSHREEELSKWSFQIIKTAVEYLEAFQGGLFILEQDEQDESQDYFTLIACYAFNEEKLLQRKIPASSGLFAKLYKTPEILYIDNLQESYQIITSALGQVTPKSIVLVPLIYNNLLIGAMEIDSFKKFEQFQLEFLEEIAGHISASLSSWKVAQQTEQLLKRYEKQTQLFKQQEKELQEKIQQLSNLSKQYKNLEQEYDTTLRLIDQFAYRAEVDENGKIISVNDRLASLYEKDNSFFVGRYISEYTGFDVVNPSYKEKWEDMLNGKIISSVESIEIGDQTVWMHEFFVAIRDTQNNLVKVLFIAIDITEAKMLERQLRIQVKEISKETRLLRREERKLRKEKEEFEKQKANFQFLISLYDKTLGRIILNRSKVILEANLWIANALGYKPEEMANQPFEKFLLQAEKNKFDQNFALCLENKEVSDTFQLLRKDGNTLKLSITFFLQDKDKKNLMIYMLLRP